MEQTPGAEDVVFPAFVEICILFDGHDPLDACLNNRTSAVHARRMSDVDRAADSAEAGPRCGVDCVPLSMLRPEVLLWPFLKTPVLVGSAAARSAVVAPRPAFAFGSNKQCADLGRVVLTELRNGVGDRHDLVVFSHALLPHCQ